MAFPSESWIILGTTPVVAAAGELQAGASVSLSRATPPRVAQLTVAPTVFPADPDPQARITCPRVVAADPASGLFLVAAPPPVSERPPTRARTCTGPDGVERTIHVGLIPQPAYFVLDVPGAAASRVPDAGGLDAACAGVIAAPGPGGGRGYMVGELQIIVGCKEATLVCFSSETGEWVEKDVRNPRRHWMWCFDDVVAHDGKLWWVDRAKGLLACDPFADQPEMSYVPLPKGGGHGGGHRRGCSYCSQRKFASRRCVQVSNGKFHCVEMGCARQGGAPSISVFVLPDPGTAEWTPKYTMSFAGFWDSDSYKAAGLPKKAPVVELIHSMNPDIIYFSVKGYFFAILMATNEVECEADEDGAVSSSSFLAWELPPSLTNDRRFPLEVSEDGKGEEAGTATI